MQNSHLTSNNSEKYYDKTNVYYYNNTHRSHLRVRDSTSESTISRLIGHFRDTLDRVKEIVEGGLDQFESPTHSESLEPIPT